MDQPDVASEVSRQSAAVHLEPDECCNQSAVHLEPDECCNQSAVHLEPVDR